MAYISSRGEKNHHTYKLTLTQASQNTSKNESTISYSFDLIDDANWYWEQWGNSISYSISANGSVIKSGSIPNHTTANQNIASGSFTVPHNADGTKSFSYSFSVTDGAGQYYTSGNASASGTMTLTTIARYFSSAPTLELLSVTETTANFKWTTPENCSWARYHIDGSASWVDIFNGGFNGGNYSPARNGTFTISGLSANSSHSIYVECARADSKLWSNSNTTNFSTYNYPHCTSSPDFTIGDTLTLNFYNPLSRNIRVVIIGDDNSTIDVYENLTTTSLSGYNASETVYKLYSSIPNSQSGRYKVIVSYGSVDMVRDEGNTYRIRGNEIPIINDLDYFDGEQTVNITNDPKQIVQNQSLLVARFHSATPTYWAGGIAQYYLECNGKTAQGSGATSYPLGTIDSANDVDLTLTAVDSRGLSASKTIKVTMVAYSNPTAVVTLQRLNNYEDETYLTVDGSVSSVNGKNTMQILYRYKVAGGNYGGYTQIADKEKQTLSLDKNNVYVFNVVITDAFSNIFAKEYTLDKGLFPLFIDIEKQSVSVNKFPRYDKSFEAQGLMSLGERQTFELEAGKSIEIPVWLALCTGLVNFRISGANLEVARLFYLFRTNEFYGTHKTLVDDSYNGTSAVVPMEMRNTEQGYIFKITNNHSSTIHIRYGILELC